jgi:hypothetical protein
VVLDSVHASGLPEQIVAMGVPRENVVFWPRNGIEYYYPPSIIDQIFGGGAEIVINGDIVSRNGILHTKSELVERSSLNCNTILRCIQNFERYFMAPSKPLSVRSSIDSCRPSLITDRWDQKAAVRISG